MQTLRTLPELRVARAALPGRVAFVPTMGALHEGHLSLVEAAKDQADHVVVSIFVNPKQFGPNEDLDRYPRQEAADAMLLARAGVALLWAPSVDVMYPASFATNVSVAGVSETLDGAHRPGHFDGVATVVLKLLNQVRPDLALFGEKDWQQLAVVRRLVADLDMPVQIVGVPTSREPDGLARSSRNVYLSAEQRAVASLLPAILREAAARSRGGADGAIADAVARLEAGGFVVDYVELVDQAMQPVRDDTAVRILAAARLGPTRLIDNFPV